MKKYILLILFFSLNSFGNKFPIAKKGFIDLSSWDFEKKGHIEVRGEWKFYPNKIINPEKDNLEVLFQNKILIKFPGIWNNVKDPRNLKNEIDPNGYGSFLLKVKGIPNEKRMGLAIKRFFSSYDVFVISGKSVQKMGGMGKVGMTKKSSVARHGPWEGQFSSPSKKGKTFFILINSSNYRHRGGGLTEEGMFLGLEEDIKPLIRNEESIKFLLIGIFIIMGLYHFSLFYQRNEDYVSLWFGLVLFSLGARLFFNNSYLDNFLTNSGNLQFLFNRRLEFISVFCFNPAVIGYIQSLFPSFMPKNVLRINLIVSLLAVIFIIFTEPITFFITLPIMWIQACICLATAIYVLVRESLMNKDYSVTFLLSFIVCFSGAIHSTLFTEHILRSSDWLYILGFLFVLIQGHILSKNFSTALKKVDRLTDNFEGKINVHSIKSVSHNGRALSSEKEKETSKQIVNL